ncbi:Pcl5p [Lachancea thermotolerans CBS 6340]|uniref:KLTH0H14740p n=1 Tax=Lachancea thermotolerans (strain ATCC 56472 / CBS 6340 / NRRL Y-8284) TaxID=559295 RepID=C5E3M3_LACTC|nr:KLTH0H14740p [Lachancea thermotolerans CBS 6340]CAR30634.1 KLTH0H14740p [Lachancea thermotolerans CBS 6340]
MQQVTPKGDFACAQFAAPPSPPPHTPDALADRPSPALAPARTWVRQSALINQIATLLSALTSKFSNHRVNNSKQHLVLFLTEVLKRSKCSKKVVLLSIYYFHKLYTYKLDSITNLPEFSRCSKRVYLCCLILAHKFLNDQTFSMSSWQRISGLSSKDISTMERWCLTKLDYELFLDDDRLSAWSRKILVQEGGADTLPVICKKRASEEDSFDLLPHKKLHTGVIAI